MDSCRFKDEDGPCGETKSATIHDIRAPFGHRFKGCRHEFLLASGIDFNTGLPTNPADRRGICFRCGMSLAVWEASVAAGTA